jgi:hypothetical protein
MLLNTPIIFHGLLKRSISNVRGGRELPTGGLILNLGWILQEYIPNLLEELPVGCVTLLAVVKDAPGFGGHGDSF